MELHLEFGYRVAGGCQIPDIPPEFATVHLIGVLDLRVEELRPLRQIDRLGSGESVAAGDRQAVELAHPGVDQLPTAGFGFATRHEPRGGSVQAPDQSVFAVEPEDLQALQGLAVGIVVAIVVDVAGTGAVLGITPLTIHALVAPDRSGVSSDPVFQLGDLGVGCRQHRVLEGRAEQGDRGRRDEGRYRQPEQTEAQGLRGDDLVALREQPERDQRRHQDEDRRHVIEDLERKIGVVGREHARWDIVVEHLVDQLGEVGDDVDCQSRRHRDREDTSEDTEDVAVHHSGKPEAERFDPQPQARPGGGAAQRQRLGLGARQAILERPLAATPDLPPSAEPEDSSPDVHPQVTVDRADHQRLVAVPAPEKERAKHQEEHVRSPHRQPGRHLPVDRGFLAVAQHDVVEQEHRHRDEESRGPPGSAVPEAERNPVQAEHETGPGDRELLLDLHPGLGPLLG